MSNAELDALRGRMNEINDTILKLLNERAQISKEIGQAKARRGLPKYDPVRERDMLNELVSHNAGPFDDNTVRHLFKEIFKASLDLQGTDRKKAMLISRKLQPEDTVIQLGEERIGGKHSAIVAGPCSVESYSQLYQTAAALKALGINLLRGGAYKPRTSPYDFQGLGEEGLQILHRVAKELNMITISEIVNPAHVDMAARYIDVIQVGARNMQNFELLKAVGSANIPVLLKRGMSATVEELLMAAEYIVFKGNKRVMLCERGIRTYERATRNTLDISAVPILKQETHLPVLVDVSHAAGRKDILVPMAKAALAAGADGVMVEVHPDPAVALSDAEQQLNIEQFTKFYEAVKQSGLFR